MAMTQMAPAMPDILCPGCGALMKANAANLCVQCIRKDIDITDGIPKSAVLHFCRGCISYYTPPGKWTQCDLESRELLAVCLKRLKGLTKVRLIDASFIWTEPHSRRIKVRIKIHKEVYANVVLEQEFVVEFVVHYQQCDQCQRRMAQQHWQAVVQLRQKVSHKKTFLYVEQLLIKHNAHKKCINIKEKPDGLDFYFLSRSDAMKMIDFLNTTVPIRYKTSERLVSHDVHTNTANLKHTYSTEIVPICKEDLVCLPPKLARASGNINQIVMCYKAANAIHCLDPLTLQVCEISAEKFWRKPFVSLCNRGMLTEFMVLDIEQTGEKKGKFALAEAEVVRMSDFGNNDKSFFVRTHLGNILKPGDAAWGYDTTANNWNNDDLLKIDPSRIPDIYLVKKSYPKSKKRSRGRNWKLMHLNKEADMKVKDDIGKENDYEQFLEDIEEDPTFRKDINVYKKEISEEEQQRLNELAAAGGDDDEFDDDDLPVIDIAEMMEYMTLDDGDAPPDAPENPFEPKGYEPTAEDVDMGM